MGANGGGDGCGDDIVLVAVVVVDTIDKKIWAPMVVVMVVVMI